MTPREEYIGERAAIRCFDAGTPRDEAERLAVLDWERLQEERK